MIRSSLFVLRAVLVAVFLLWGIGAEAQEFGIRAGISFEPEQFYIGVHTETGPVFDELRFRPNIEAGFGDNRTVITLNGEFVYPFELRNGTQLYAGGGPSIVIISKDLPESSNGDETDVEPGFNFLIGMKFMENYFTELKVGLIKSPEFKIGFGYTFP